MSEKRLTLLELHLHDADVQFGPEAISTGGSEAESASDETTAGDGTSADADEATASGSRTGLAALVGLVFLVAIAIAVKKLSGGTPDEALEKLEDLDERES